MSIVEIAKAANVSISTVSRYLNRPEKVSPEAAGRIREIISRVNYQPSIRRPGPKTEGRAGIRTGVIVFLSVSDLSPEEMLRRPAFPILIGNLQRVLIEKQLTLQMAHLTPDQSIPACLDAKNCDGVIIFGHSESPEIFQLLQKQLANIPAVWCFREHNDPDHRFDHILYDNSAVGVIAAEYLSSHGHRKVAVFNSNLEHTGFCERIHRFTQRAAELGMQVTSFDSKREDESTVTFRKLAGEFQKNSDGITGAFFCADDIMLGVCNELRAAGYPTGRLDAIGCNAEEALLRYFSPRPASIDIKMGKVAELAVSHLLRRINAEGTPYSCEIFVKPELVVGNNKLFA